MGKGENQIFETIKIPFYGKFPFAIQQTDERKVIISDFYNRDNGKEKIVRQVEGVVSKIQTTSSKYIFSLFDEVFAIDTNTNKENGIYTGAICRLSMLGENEIKYEIYTRFVGIKFDGNNPESRAIEEFIHKINTECLGIKDKNICIFTDSRLGELNKINSNEIPLIEYDIIHDENSDKIIHEKIFLPKNIKLMYASADTGISDSIFNKVIKICDKEATRYYQQLKNEGIIDKIIKNYR